MTYRAELYALVGLGLIVECPSGIVWTNQTGGAWNLHPEIEGLFVPIRTWDLGPTWQQGSSRPPDADESPAAGAPDPRVPDPSWRAPDGSFGVVSPSVELFEYFWGPKYAGRGAERGLDVGDADFIDGVLSKHSLGDYITVDRDRLKDSDEAWVRVVVHQELSFSGVDPLPCPGVLTWMNSD